jgi:uncharacterized protein (TIGR02996 family)
VTERDALFAAALDQPADDTARLVLADWLEEHGEGDLGRFLRAGVVASRFRAEGVIEDPAYYAALAEIAAVAKGGSPARWVASLDLTPGPHVARDWSWDSACDRVTVRVGESAGVFARGMLAELELPLDRWYAVAYDVLRRWPLDRVRATDVPGLSFAVERLEGGWRLTGRVRLPRRNVPLTGHVIPSAYAPGAMLAESGAEWAADQHFADRAALAEGVGRESAAIVADLKDAAGDRWPRPRTRRRP